MPPVDRRSDKLNARRRPYYRLDRLEIAESANEYYNGETSKNTAALIFIFIKLDVSIVMDNIIVRISCIINIYNCHVTI